MSETKVVALNGAKFKENGVSEDIVDLLQELLESAHRGEIKHLATLAVTPGNEIRVRSIGSSQRLLAASLYLQKDLMKD